MAGEPALNLDGHTKDPCEGVPQDLNVRTVAWIIFPDCAHGYPLSHEIHPVVCNGHMAGVVKLYTIRQREFIGKDGRPTAVNDIAESVTRDCDVGDVVEIHAAVLGLIVSSARRHFLTSVS